MVRSSGWTAVKSPNVLLTPVSWIVMRACLRWVQAPMSLANLVS